MPIVGKYPQTYINYKGEVVTRLPDSQLPQLGIGMDFTRTVNNPDTTSKYYKKKRKDGKAKKQSI